MKRFLFSFFLLVSLVAQAQVRPPSNPPTLTYRQRNTNQLDMIISSAGTLLTPSSSVSITAEVRLSDVGRIVANVPMTTVDSVDGTIRGMLPNLDPSIYYLGLYIKYASGEPEFRVGIGRLEIVPTGSLRVVTDASGLNIQISEVRQVLNVKLDATPSSAIAAYYAQQVRADVVLINQTAAGITTQVNSATASAAQALAYKNAAGVSADSAASRTLRALSYRNTAKTWADSTLARANRALTSQANAKTSETNASNSATSASNSATSAGNSATAAGASATSASNSASAANTSKNNAGTSELNAGNSATAAGTSATNAANSATAANNSKVAAGTSETNAAASASSANTSKNAAASSATNAATSETSAGNSAAAANTSKNNAATSASNAATSESNASNSATAANTSKNNAATSESNAGTSATAAGNSATSANNSAMAAANSALASVQAFKGAWTASTAYATGDLVTNGGSTYRRKSAGTSGSSFDSSMWDVTALGGSVADNTVSTSKLVDAAITPAKTSFLVLGKNLFNAANGTDGFFLNGTGDPAANASYGYSDYITAPAGLTYTVADAAGTVRKISFYNTSKVFVSEIDASATSTKTFTTPTNTAFIRITYNVTRKGSTQVESGSAQTSWAAYGFTANSFTVSPSLITTDASNRFSTDVEITGWNGKLDASAVVITPGAKNLFDVSTATDGFYISIGGSPTASGTYGYSDYITITPGLSYAASDGTNGMRTYAYYTASKAYISDSQSTTTTISVPTNLTATVAYIRLSYFQSGKATFQFEQASAPTSWVPFKKGLQSVNGGLITPKGADIIQDASNRHATDTQIAAWNAKIDASAIVSVASKNLFDLTKGTDGFTLNTDGSLQANATYGFSDYMSVTAGAQYVGASASTLMRRIHYYNSSKTFISFVDSPANPVTIPTGVSYARASYWVADKATFQFELGSVKTTYASFPPTLVSVNGATLPTTTGSVSATTSAQLVLPQRLYAVVGKEFNLYYDACTLLPEYGPNQPNFLFDIVCSKGSMGYRSFRFTPTSGDVGSYPLTFNVLDNKGNITETASSTLVVVAASNPSTVKHILHFGDSTIDESTTTKTIQENLAALGGNVPIFHGQHHPAPYKNEARTGRSWGTFAGISGTLAYKFYVTGVPTNLDLTNIRNTYYYTGTSSNVVLLSERWNIAGDGTGWIIGYYFGAYTPPTSFPTTLIASSAPGFPANITVTNAETLNGFSIFKNSDGVGALDISFYRQTVLGMSSATKFDQVIVDLGINDISTGTVLSDAQVTSIIDNAKLSINAFLADNSACKILLSLPKSHSSDYFISSRRQSVFRVSMHKLRKALLANFDFNASYPNVYISQSGYGIDRFYGYPNAAQAPAARISTPTFTGTTDDVHPNTGGYQQVGDGVTGGALYLLNLP